MIPAKTPALISSYFTNYTWNKPNAEKRIYLSFDDGPIPEVTPWILSILDKYQIPATFFCVGENIKKYPDVFEQILNQNHSVGNHTYNHLNGWKTSKKDYLDNIKDTEKVINDFGVNTSLFRPPYGKLSPKQSKSIIDLGYEVVMWSILSKDYSQKISAKQVYDNITNNITSGSIIVCHDNIKAFENLKESLEPVVKKLLEKGFVFGKLAG